MIHLDTNYLVGLVTSSNNLKSQFLTWFNAGEKFSVSAIAWSEFLNGPVTDIEVKDAFGIVESRIIIFGTAEAEVAANLFNQAGRKRGTQTDGFIAATAICSNSPLATLNQKDFLPYVALGLRLA